MVLAGDKVFAWFVGVCVCVMRECDYDVFLAAWSASHLLRNEQV